MKNIIGYDMADVLALAGLARRPTMLEAILPAVGLIAVGAVVGAGLGLLFAPESGRLLRADVRQGVETRVGQLKERAMSDKGARTETREAFPNNGGPHSSV
jgi:hypothetical protein